MPSTKRDQDTICAVATPPGVSALAVIRLSGGDAETIVRKIAPTLTARLESHRAYHLYLSDEAGAPLDEAIVTHFAKGRSYTGETSFEISCHGSQVIVEQILRALVSAGSRMAERGEFTYRAFMNGRIDLVQAESILDLIESQSPQAAKIALNALRGELSGELQKIENDITWVLAQLEANIDFSSEDIVFTSAEKLLSRLSSSRAELERLCASYKFGRVLKEGLTVALVGAPNVGKSSLFNKLVGEDRAIVSIYPGTTRDPVDFIKHISGHRIRFVDSAGIRDTSDEIERLGIERTRREATNADVILHVIDASERTATAINLEPRSAPVITVGNKSDLLGLREGLNAACNLGVDVLVSAQTGFGLEQLMNLILTHAKGTVLDGGITIQRARQFEAMSMALKYLEAGEAALKKNRSPEFIAADLYASLQELLRLRGVQVGDEVTDLVFREFCIGK